MNTVKQLELPLDVEIIVPASKIVPLAKESVYPKRDVSMDANTEKMGLAPPKVRDDVRVCDCCQQQKPLNRDFFHVAGYSENNAKVYYRRICKICANAAARKKMKAEAKAASKNLDKPQQVMSPLQQALLEAHRVARQAWDDYQMAVDLFRRNIVTSTRHRKIKFTQFLEAQKVVKTLEATQTV